MGSDRPSGNCMSTDFIFIGGYAKSGTTFVGRVFDIINGVYGRGEMDYFRIFAPDLNKQLTEYNRNLLTVNKEVYDGAGSLAPVTKDQARIIHRRLFLDLFFNGSPLPDDCSVIVEKSPRNIFHIAEIDFIFPKAKVVCVYRDPIPVFRSLMRHMSDHRSAAYRDPTSEKRTAFLDSFIKNRWPLYIKILKNAPSFVRVVRYDTIAADTAGFIDYAETQLIGVKRGIKRDLNTLTKDYYLSQLSPEARAKSLVQTGGATVHVSDAEISRIERDCELPTGPFDF